MRILFASAQPFLPQIVGGVETSTVELSRLLMAQGHQVASMNGIATGDALYLRNRTVSRLTGRRFPHDTYEGIRVYRGWVSEDGVPGVLEHFGADAVVAQGGTTAVFDVLRGCLRCGVPTFFYVHDVNPLADGLPIPGLAGVRWIANSPFTQRFLRSRLGVDSEVVPPCMDLRKYQTSIPGQLVTMVNPRVKKGGDLALEVAHRCPDIPFLFVEGWRGSDEEMQKMKASSSALTNVTWLPEQQDMRAVYRRTRLVLMPSRMLETWGRVVTEAQASGIPAITSDAGALPETVGPGGLTLPSAAHAETWVDTVRGVLGDAGLYARLSQAARAQAERREVSAGQVAEKFVSLLTRAAGSGG